MTQRWFRLSLILILLAAFALRLTDLTRQNIWWDEARNIDVALRPLAQIATAPELDIQPPLYYWLLHGWLGVVGVQVGDDPALIAFFARFLSVLAGVLGVALIPILTNLSFPPRNEKIDRQFTIRNAQLAALLAAFSPFWLAESQETRMYTVGMLWLMLAAVAWMSGQRVASEERRPEIRDQKPRFAIRNSQFAILSALALLTHYNAVFILVAWYSWWGGWALMQHERWQHLRRALVSGLLTILFVSPIVPIALRQIPTYENPNLVVPTVADYLRQNWVAYLAGYAFDPALLAGNGMNWVWGVLAIVGIGLLWEIGRWGSGERGLRRELNRTGQGFYVSSAEREREIGVHKIRNPQSAIHNPQFPFLLAWLFGGLALYYIAVIDRGAFNVRYASFVTPALYVLIGAGLAGWSRWWRPLGWIAAALLLSGLLPALRSDLTDPRFFREDTQGVANWLRQNTQAGDLILVDQKYPLGFYYKRFAIDSSAQPVGVEPVDARYLFVDVNTIDQRLNEWARRAKRIFWVQWFESDTDPRRAIPFLLNQQGRQVGTQPFQGYTLDWWEMTPPNHFVLAPGFTPLQVRAASAVATIEYSLPATFTTGMGVPVVIRWQRVAEGVADRPLKVRIALYDTNDNRLAQADERLLNDRHLMPPFWDLSDQPLNLYWLEPPAELPSGEYVVRLLIYDSESSEAIPLFNVSGNSLGIEVPLEMIEKI